jgi:CubicO group peptidase (beta-lactamase class C family)
LLRTLDEKGKFNGVVLVSEHSKVIYKKAFGYANMETKDTLILESNFRMASVSKQFTAMCIMILEEQGKLDYDDDFQKYLPELKYEGITIRHLLWHTSGIPDYIELMDELWDPNIYYVNDDVLKLMAKHLPEKDFEPGEKYEYSNTGYVLLASIVERLSGVSFKEFVQQNIFDRIGMSSSVIPIGEKEFEEMVNRTYGFDISDNEAGYIENEYDHYNAYGDGGIYSNLDDLFKWNEALYTEKLVKHETIEEAFKPYVLNNGHVGDYGFGWKLYRGAKQDVIEHTGDWVGFRTLIRRDLKNRNAIIILSNNSREVEEIRLGIDKILLGKSSE